MKILGFVLLWLAGSAAAVAVAWAGVSIVDDELIDPAPALPEVAAVHTPATRSIEPVEPGPSAGAAAAATETETLPAPPADETDTDSSSRPSTPTPMPSQSTPTVEPAAPTSSAVRPTPTSLPTPTAVASQSIAPTSVPARQPAVPPTPMSPTPVSLPPTPIPVPPTPVPVPPTPIPVPPTPIPPSPTPMPPTPAPTSPPSQSITFSLVGGTTAISFSPSVVEVLWASANPGFTVEIERESSGIEVEFEADHHESRIEAWWAGGPQHEIREEPED